MEKQPFLDKIQDRVQRTIPPQDYSVEELRTLVALLPPAGPVPAIPACIPLTGQSTLDPRLRSSAYLHRITEWKCWPVRAQELHLPFLKLPLVLALENVLVSVSHLSAYEDVASVVDAVHLQCGDGYSIHTIHCEGEIYIVVERPHAATFLESLFPTFSFHLISALPAPLTSAILSALCWTPYFSSTVSQQKLATISTDFPSITNPERLLIILDDTAERWGRDRVRVFPSLRFLAGREASSVQYCFGAKSVVFPGNRPNPVIEVKSRPQLPALITLLEKVAKQAWKDRYNNDVLGTMYAYRRAYTQVNGKRVKVQWWREDEFRVLEWIVRAMGGKLEANVSQAEVVITNNSAAEAFGQKLTLPCSRLYSSYFLV